MSTGTPKTIRIVNTSGVAGPATLVRSAGGNARVATIQMVATSTPGGGTALAYSPQRVAYSTGRLPSAGTSLTVTPIAGGTAGVGGGAKWSSAGGAQHHRQAPAPAYAGLGKRPALDSLRKFSHRQQDKSKGLRHFSTKVCEKVKDKGRTNYNEVADELVQEYFESIAGPAPGDTAAREKQQYDMKNIRRRVYDALNVLMAMNIIEKEKKEIRWVGLPTSSIQECRRLEEEKTRRLDRIKQKAEQLQELIIQMVAYKSLVARNKAAESTGTPRPPPSSLLYLPYIVLNTHKNTLIDCSISHDKTEYLFQFDRPFEIHDDIEVLKRLGLAQGLEKAQVSKEALPRVKECLPSALRSYVDEICEGKLAGGQVGPSVRPTIAIQRPLGRAGGMGMYSSLGPAVKVVSGGADSGGAPRQVRYAVVRSTTHHPGGGQTEYQYHGVPRRSGGTVQYVIQQSPAQVISRPAVHHVSQAHSSQLHQQHHVQHHQPLHQQHHQQQHQQQQHHDEYQSYGREDTFEDADVHMDNSGNHHNY